MSERGEIRRLVDDVSAVARRVPEPRVPRGDRARIARGELAALEAFRRAAREVPAYASRLARLGVSAPGVRHIQDFRLRVPLLDKHSVFGGGDIAALCRGGTLDGVVSVMTSSGHSGVFSFGVATAESLRETTRSLDRLFEQVVPSAQHRTLFVNCLPMGLKIPSTAVTSAETGLREDVVAAVVQKFARFFDQVVLGGEAPFLKRALEEGRERGIDWSTLPVWLGAGNDGFAENWRSYVCSLLARDGDEAQPRVVSTMGLAELGLNLFQETSETIRVRRLAHRDSRLRALLFGEDVVACPMFFVYDPEGTYLEVTGDSTASELVVTKLDSAEKIPLIRYQTGDRAALLGREEVARALSACGYPEDLVGGGDLPFVAVFGRTPPVSFGGQAVYPEQVREAIYRDIDVAAALTGHFRISAPDRRRGRVEVQGKADEPLPESLRGRLRDSIASFVAGSFDLEVSPYRRFRHAMALNYERKFCYVEDRSVRVRPRPEESVRSSDPAERETPPGIEGALAAFHRAARRVPAYARALKRSGVDPAGVTTYPSFRRAMPILDNQTLAAEQDVRDLCLDGDMSKARFIVPSSGHSGLCSFGVEDWSHLESRTRVVDEVLERFFSAGLKKTLVINALPQGLRIPTTKGVLSEVGLREDALHALVKTFSRNFEQTVLLGEWPFLKKAIEEGGNAGCEWKAHDVHLLVFGEPIAEGWRDYVRAGLGLDAGKSRSGLVLSTFGAAELGGNLFFETPQTIRIRRLARRDTRLREALFGAEARVCPMFLVYEPDRTFLEIGGEERVGPLLVTMNREESQIPLIRYATGDRARLFTGTEVRRILQQCGSDCDLLPPGELSYVAIYGRLDPVVVGVRQVFTEEIQEALFLDFDVAAGLTGNFRIRATPQEELSVEFQSKRDRLFSGPLLRRLEEAIRSFVDVPLRLRVHAYEEFPQGTSLDYERKFVHVGG